MAALPPFDQHLLAWVALAPMIFFLPEEPPRKTFWLGLLAGTVTNYGAFHWCTQLMTTYSELGMAAYLIMLVMGLYQGLVCALWCALVSRLNEYPRWLLAPAIWVALEYFFPIVFPYYLANTQHSFALTSQMMDLLGPSGLSWVVVAVNVAVAEAARALAKRSYSRLAIAVGLLLGLLNLGYGGFRISQWETRLETAPSWRVGVVQANIWIRGTDPLVGHHRYQRMTAELAEQDPDLVVLPESAIKLPPGLHLRQGEQQPHFAEPEKPYYPLDLAALLPSPTKVEPTLAEDLQGAPQLSDRLAVVRQARVPVLFGTSAVDLSPGAEGPIPGRPPLYNAAFLADADGSVSGVALKNELLIFGEYFPGSSLYPQIYNLLPHASALYAGTEPAVLTLDQVRVGVMICYEDLLSWFALRLAAKNPDVLINLSNEAWFGVTAEPAAHLALSKARSIELRRYLVRSTPTGISAVIDPLGRSVKETRVDSQEAFVEEIRLLREKTVFQTLGNSFAWLCLFVVLAATLKALRKETR